MKELVLTLVVISTLANSNKSFGQFKIEIGDDSRQIAQSIEWLTKDHNRPDTYGNTSQSLWTYDIKYFNGKIIDVIQCYDNELILEFRLVTNFCRHYVMEEGKLANILSQYQNLSIQELIKLHEKHYGDSKIGDYYFSSNFKHYTRLYLHSNGYATAEWRKTKINEFPRDLQPTISLKLNAADQEEKKKKVELERERRDIEDIKSKVYDIEIKDSALYKERKQILKQSVFEYLNRECEKKQSDVPYFRYGPNVYNLSYTLSEVTSSYPTQATCDLKSGTDKGCSLFNNAFLMMTPIEINGISVRTTASFNDFKVLYYCGEIQARKSKSGETKYVGDLPNDPSLVQELTQALTKYSNGKYQLKYEFGSIGGEKFNFIDVLN